MLFTPPPVIETEVFARVPENLRVKPGKMNRFMEINRGGEWCDVFLEGPCFDRAGDLYLVDLAHGRILRAKPDGVLDVVSEYGGEPNGLAIHKDGRMFIADHRHGILILDPNSGGVTPYVEDADVENFKGPNDLYFSDDGVLWFTDQGQTGLHDPTGRLYRFDGRQLDAVISNIPSPNGLAMAPGDRMMYVCVTRDNALWRVPLSPEGRPYKVGRFIQLSGGLGGPDGMAVGADGSIFICHVGMGAVWGFTHLGEPLCRINSCEKLGTTNAAFGGDDGKTLFITDSASGCILKAQVPVAGRRLYSHAD